MAHDFDLTGSSINNPNLLQIFCGLKATEVGEFKGQPHFAKPINRRSLLPRRMALAGIHHPRQRWRFCPFWGHGTASTNSSSSAQNLYPQPRNHASAVSSVAKSLLPARKRLRFDPSSHLYFPYEPGKQARSAVRIRNSSKSHIAFKFQTTAPKSCYMRPPGGILAPGESLVASVFKFVEHPEDYEKPLIQKSRVKFKIMSLKVEEGIDYFPELFDEQRDNVIVERVLRAIFLDPERASPALEKLKRQLAEADAATETCKKPPAKTGMQVVGDGLVLDIWKERREKYLARQQVEAEEFV